MAVSSNEKGRYRFCWQEHTLRLAPLMCWLALQCSPQDRKGPPSDNVHLRTFGWGCATLPDLFRVGYSGASQNIPQHPKSINLCFTLHQSRSPTLICWWSYPSKMCDSHAPVQSHHLGHRGEFFEMWFGLHWIPSLCFCFSLPFPLPSWVCSPPWLLF